MDDHHPEPDTTHLSERTRKRYRNAARAYLRFAQHVERPAASTETMLAYLHHRRDLSNTTLRNDAYAAQWRLGIQWTDHTIEIHDYLQAHRRWRGGTDDDNTVISIAPTDVAKLLTAPWPANRAGGELLIARGVAAAALLAAAGPSGTAATIARLAADDADALIAAANTPAAQWVRRGNVGPIDVATALAMCRAAAAAAGTPLVFGWVVCDGEPVPAQRAAESLRPQLQAAARRAGCPPDWHPAAADEGQLARLLAHVDPSYRLELRTRAQVAFMFATACRHSDAASVRLPLIDHDDHVIARVERAKQCLGGYDVYVDHLPQHGTTCPACHVLRWAAELTDGPLFPSLQTGGAPLTSPVAADETLEAIRRLSRGAGIVVDGTLGTHSFRKGHDDARIARGETPEEIAATTHQSPQVLYRHYISNDNRFRNQARLRPPTN